MSTRLPAREDYYRPTRARALRRRAARLERWGSRIWLALWLVLAALWWPTIGAAGLIVAGIQSSVLGLPICLGLWSLAGRCQTAAGALEAQHRVRHAASLPDEETRCLPTWKCGAARFFGAAVLGSLFFLWLLGFQAPMPLGSAYFHLRLYSASSPSRPYYWHAAPRQGLDCQSRMESTSSGETARSIRVGDLVLEVSQPDGLAMGPSVLHGTDCR